MNNEIKNTDIKKYELLENKYKLRKKIFKKEFFLSWNKRKKAKLNFKRARKLQKKLKQEILLEKMQDPNKIAKFKTKLLRTESKIATLDYKLQDLNNKIKEKTKSIEDINSKISELEEEILQLEKETETLSETIQRGNNIE
jgi:hypothetical protein